MDKICYKCGSIMSLIDSKYKYRHYHCTNANCGEIIYPSEVVKQMERDRMEKMKKDKGENKMEIVFKHGALAGTYEEQANEQGFTFGENAELIQSIGDSILQVYDEDLVNSKEYDQILETFHRKRLTNKKYLKRLEG